MPVCRHACVMRCGHSGLVLCMWLLECNWAWCERCPPWPHAPAFRPNTQIPALEQELLLSLLPKDENDARGVVVEVRWRAERHLLRLGAFARPRANCPLVGLAFLAELCLPARLPGVKPVTPPSPFTVPWLPSVGAGGRGRRRGQPLCLGALPHVRAVCAGPRLEV